MSAGTYDYDGCRPRPNVMFSIAFGPALAERMISVCALISLVAAPRLQAQAAVTTSAQVRDLAGTPATTLVVRPGDQVRVIVWRKPELSGDFLVAADSTLKHPLYQDIKVGGLSVAAAHQRIEEYLRRLETNPQVSLEPLFRVSVGGEVRAPNLYSLSPETSIAQAVALAGGPTERGRLDRVRVLRDGRELLVDITSASGGWLQAPIASGDQIFVGRQGNFLRDLGVPLLTSLGGIASIVGLILRK
jgi:polysaccharide export outer membrane protein